MEKQGGGCKTCDLPKGKDMFRHGPQTGVGTGEETGPGEWLESVQAQEREPGRKTDPHTHRCQWLLPASLLNYMARMAVNAMEVVDYTSEWEEEVVALSAEA